MSAATHASAFGPRDHRRGASFHLARCASFPDRAADLERHDKKRGITDQKVSLGAVTRVEVDGAGAYVVVPSVYTFKERGAAMKETAQMTFTLKKGAGGWLFHGWTWTGPKAQKAK